jgi:hypothetical protein
MGIATISLYAFLLLVKTRTYVTASFGDMGGIVSYLRLTFVVVHVMD